MITVLISLVRTKLVTGNIQKKRGLLPRTRSLRKVAVELPRSTRNVTTVMVDRKVNKKTWALSVEFIKHLRCR